MLVAPLAESDVSVMLASTAPAAVGVNTYSRLQLSPGARVIPAAAQLPPDRLKGAAGSAIAETERSALPELLSVTRPAGLLAPIVISPKSTAFVLSVSTGSVPVPLTPPVGAALLTVSVSTAPPAAVGEKSISSVQLSPAGSANAPPLQLPPVMLKGADSPLMADTFSTAVPVF